MPSAHAYLARDSNPAHSTPDELRFMYQGRVVVVFKRWVHQWRTDLMLRVDGREVYIARQEGGMTRGEVKEMARRKLDAMRR